jgi:hypothetical protein
METITKVVVPQKEPKHTPAGQRKRVIQLKALLFVALWEFFKDKPPKEIKEKFDSYVVVAIKKAGIEQTEHNRKLIQDAIDEVKEQVFLKSKRIWLLRCLEKDGFDLMFGKDETLASKLIALINRNQKITSAEYIKSILSHAHLTFYGIGRERKWNEQEIITPEFGQDKPIVNAGNPLTTSVRKEVKGEFEKLEREHKFTANIQVDGKEKVVSIEKHGLPASVAVIYYVIIHMLCKLLNGVKRLNDTRRMVNMAHLMLLWTITLHEGARPGDTMEGTQVTDFVFRFGKEYHMLVLAFVSAPTLAYLLGSNHLKRFRFESFKGKTVREYRGRWHSWLPWEYNSIDLAFIYILVMRIIAFVDPTQIQRKVFSKSKTNLSDIRKHTNEALGIKGLVMYSIRYALCEESLTYASMIPGQWIKYVMGHVKSSFMRHRYANNVNQRVSIDNIMTLLGGDVSNSVTDDTIPIGFHPFNDDKMDDVAEGTPQNIIDELNAIQKDINQWLAGSNESASSMASLMQRVPKLHDEFFEGLSHQPFGAHFGFKAGVLSAQMESKLNDTIKELQSNFFARKEIPPSTSKVVIWSYGQIMFGEWHKSNQVQAQREYESMQARQLIAALQKEIMKVDCGTVPHKTKEHASIKRKNTNEQKPTVNKKVKHVRNEDDGEVATVKENSLFTGYSARALEPNDVVFIKCSMRDKWSIKVPNIKDLVWVCHIHDVILPKHKQGHVQIVGNFYTGKFGEMKYDETSSQSVKVLDDDVAYVMNGLDENEIKNLELEEDEMQELLRFWAV